MLYMVISTHGPDMCPAANESAKQMALAMAPKMVKVAESHGCAIQGSWIHPSNHTSWVIMDAPHAHAVEQTVWELDLAKWNTIDIHPIVTMQEAMTNLLGA